MRKTFHIELKELQKDILKMGSLVENAVQGTVSALIQEDMDKAEEVIQGDDAIDELSIALEERSMQILARQSPVAKDLRLIHAILFITIHLERMGDLAFNIAKMVENTSEMLKIKTLLDIISEMGVLSGRIVNASLEAFSKQDLNLAKKLPKMDEPIDELFNLFFTELAKYLGEESMIDSTRASSLVLAARYLERIADHAVDIGERVCYLITGEIKEMD